ncbi:MAG: hypothetical protein J4F41_03615 [Alphaproteobacteria bacterium]|nr:hypothetical protein [Alphaproteobacteria bacterium]
MRLGILQAGEINPEMKAGLPSYRDMYDALFSSPDVELTYFQVMTNEFPDSVTACDAYIVTGSPAGVYDEFDWIPALMDFIRDAYNAGQQLVGICFGHQVIAEALGGKAEKSDKGWGVGVRTVAINDHGGLIPKDHDDISLLYMHQDQVVETPPGAEVLAGDSFCPIAAYKIGEQVLCMQGHPEFTPEVIAGILDFRRDVIGDDRVRQGHDSLKTPHQGKDVGQWFKTFFHSNKFFSTHS